MAVGGKQEHKCPEGGACVRLRQATPICSYTAWQVKFTYLFKIIFLYAKTCRQNSCNVNNLTPPMHQAAFRVLYMCYLFPISNPLR